MVVIRLRQTQRGAAKQPLDALFYDIGDAAHYHASDEASTSDAAHQW